MRNATLIAALVSTVVLPLAASAQDGFVTTVLLPDSFRVDAAETQLMLENLEDAVETHPDFTLNEIPPQTLDELLLAVGCTEPSPDCLDIVNEILESDFLVFGELGATDRAFLVEMTLWDFEAREAVRRFTKAVEVDLEEFRALIPLLARGIVYGDVGRVNISVNPPEAEVLFDQRPAGESRPILVEHIELGTHVIRATADGYFDYSETIYVGLEEAEINVDLVPTSREVEVKGGRVWTWVALGTGLAFTGAGVAFALVSQSTQDQYNDGASSLNPDLDELKNLQDQGEFQSTLANVFFIAGGVALATAVVLFFVEGPGEAVVPDEEGDDGTDVSVVPHIQPDGYGLTVDIEF